MSQPSNRFERRICSLEAALYSAGRPLEIESLKPIVGTKSDKVVRKLVRYLAQRYSERRGALEVVVHKDDRVSIQLKERYDSMVKQFNHKPLLTVGPLKTLSYIAFHQPVDQRQVIADRGSHIYGQLRMMESMGLIHRERTEERSYLITTTAFYGDYFGFSHNPAKSKLQLKQIFRELKITKIDNGNGSSQPGLLELEDMEDDEFLADSGDRLPEGLPQYSGASNNGS
ncbi:SMC-Scp complex subunit ScpB [Candidatus Bathyarchaeota archaeon]|nr:SMC-Scp complex subunit ScpB [Candidatus Bathyarchaeota archaeon]